MPKKKTDAEIITALIKELRRAVDQAVTDVFDRHPDPVLPGGEGWCAALSDDVLATVRNFAAEMRYDVRQEKKLRK